MIIMVIFIMVVNNDYNPWIVINNGDFYNGD